MVRRLALLSIYSVSAIASSLGQTSQDERANCTDGNYTTSNGLNFATSCNSNILSSTDFSPPYKTTENDFAACATTCSSTRSCYGAIFTETSGLCELKQFNSGMEAYAYPGHDALIVSPPTQLSEGYDTTCPYTNLTQVETSNQMTATVYCGLAIVGSDYCPMGNTTCAPHATSLQQCLDFCSQSHPLCWGVSYDPTVITGWGNCYLKGQRMSEDQFTVTGQANTGQYQGAILHSAVVDVRNGTSITVACSNDSEVITTKGTFLTQCDANQSGNDLWNYHEDTLEACVDKCANWNSGVECIAVAYDAQVLNGWENCYLKNRTNDTQSASNWTLAVVKAPLPSDISGSSDSKAQTSGVSLSVLALLALLIGIPLWLRRRRRRRRMMKTDDNGFVEDGFEKAELPTSSGSPRQQQAPNMYEVDNGTPMGELDGRSQPAELPG